MKMGITSCWGYADTTVRVVPIRRYAAEVLMTLPPLETEGDATEQALSLLSSLSAEYFAEEKAREVNASL